MKHQAATDAVALPQGYIHTRLCVTLNTVSMCPASWLCTVSVIMYACVRVCVCVYVCVRVCE